jgi:hypothetical protein
MTLQDQVLAYARKLKADNPQIDPGELRSMLRHRFSNEFTTSSVGSAGLVTNIADWITGLGKIFSGLSKLISPEQDASGIDDIIDGVMTIIEDGENS